MINKDARRIVHLLARVIMELISTYDYDIKPLLAFRNQLPLDEIDDIELDDAEEVSELAMTSLGKLVFTDIYSRHQNSSSKSSSTNSTESLLLGFEKLFFMPCDIIEKYGSTAQTIDISHNRFCRNLNFLTEFDNLTSLNMDYNNVDSFTVFPYMPKLQLLWLNHNNIDNLFPFIKNLNESCPNLQYLCLMGNKAAPSYLNGGSFYDYLQYRLFVISWIPHLIHLDDRTVTTEQKLEAKRLYKRPLLEQISGKLEMPNCIKQLHNKITTMFTIPNILPDKFTAFKGSNLII